MRILLSLTFIIAFPIILKRCHCIETIENGRVIHYSLIAYLAIVLYITVLSRKYEDEIVVYFNVFKSHQYIWETILKGLIESGFQGAIKRFHWVKGAIEGHILNTVMFIPLGYLIHLQRRGSSKLYWILLIAILFSLFIEITQLVTHRGWFDANDLLHNTLGAMIGHLIYKKVFCDVNVKSKLDGGDNGSKS